MPSARAIKARNRKYYNITSHSRDIKLIPKIKRLPRVIILKRVTALKQGQPLVDSIVLIQRPKRQPLVSNIVLIQRPKRQPLVSYIVLIQRPKRQPLVSYVVLIQRPKRQPLGPLVSYIVLIQRPKRQPLLSNNYSTNSEMIKAAACEKYSNHPERKKAASRAHSRACYRVIPGKKRASSVHTYTHTYTQDN